VPYFQRSYTWKDKQLREMHEDLTSIVDGLDKVNFTGALILYRKPGIKAGDTSIFEIVDGQQRITTFLLYLLSLTKVFSDNKEFDIAGRCFEFLLIRGRTNNLSNIAFYPCNKDRNQFYNIIDKVLNNKKLTNYIEFTPKYLERTGLDTGNIKNQFSRISKILANEYKLGGSERLELFFETLVTKFKFVQISLSDPTNATRIFERLNYRGERVTIGDLVRNEVFSRATESESDSIDQTYRDFWVPFYEKFGDDSKFETYLFSYALILDSKLAKSQVFGLFRDKWRSKSISEIITCLEKYQDSFLDIIYNKNTLNLDVRVKNKFTDLYNLRAPSTIYPFIIQVAYNVHNENLSSSEAVRILEAIESYFVRRAVYGLEPTGIHAIFKGLWDRVGDDMTAENVIKAIKSSKTMPWPNDDDFMSAIKTRSLYGSSICAYLLREYDKDLGGEKPANKFEIEHVLPRTITEYWSNLFTDDEHHMYKNVLANLLPISKPLNGSCGNRDYLYKRSRYIDDAMFKSSRAFGNQYKIWNLDNLIERSQHLALWAKGRWKYK
jgi:uncharacterized protein with ParB-like and HNH nuclease domain